MKNKLIFKAIYNTKTAITAALFLCVNSIKANTLDVSLKWQPTIYEVVSTDTFRLLSFIGAHYKLPKSHLPEYFFSKTENGIQSGITYTLKNLIYDTIPQQSLAEINGLDEITEQFVCKSALGYAAGQTVTYVDVIPLRKNGKLIERLQSFTLVKNILSEPKAKSLNLGVVPFAAKSVLSEGKWQKISIKESGIYKLTYDDLKGMGFEPSKVKIYGNGGLMLSPYFYNRNYDDLVENGVLRVVGSDGVFNSGDYILFYAQGTTGREFISQTVGFRQLINRFSDESTYFITANDNLPVTIPIKEIPGSATNYNADYYTDFQFYEPEQVNILKSGAEWFSSQMLPGMNNEYSFKTPDILPGSARLEIKVAGRSIQRSNSFNVANNGVSIGNIYISNVSLSSTYNYVNLGTFASNVTPSANNDVKINLTFNAYEQDATGYVDYVTLNYRRKTILGNSALIFADTYGIGSGITAKYKIDNATNNTVVWDITDHTRPQKVATNLSGSTLSFVDNHSALVNYVAFNTDGSFPKPKIIGEVNNQNIHGSQDIDLMIVTSDEFKPEALRLAELHKSKGLKVGVFTNQEIYNEFSSGVPDVTAIRWCAKSFYDRPYKLRYLLLFGDGSYNNKQVAANGKLILTYESENSIDQSDTYVSDDYFTFFDINEGSAGYTDNEDIAVGRLPISSLTEAKTVVDKIIHYCENKTQDKWKNTVTFMADDEDGNLHMQDGNDLADKFARLHPQYYVKKIFLDAYKQVSLTNGQFYPDAKKDFEETLSNGTLFINYSGHGGEDGLTAEKVITNNDVLRYNNGKKLPLWITATCEFSRFDNEEKLSAGENVLLNPKGGGIALITTTRLVYAGQNKTYVSALTDSILAIDKSGQRLRLGDFFRISKRNTTSDENKRKFVLLGDPAMEILSPTYSVKTEGIYSPEGLVKDTLKALDNVVVDGYVYTSNGDTAFNFNGYVYPTVFDKISNKTTLMNDYSGEYARPFTFSEWENVLFTGKSEVRNGKFTYKFQVPKDINYQMGEGQILYYATSSDGSYEANGFTRKFFVGNFNANADVDKSGPQITGYLNTSAFTNGAIVDANPLLIAHIFDESGINTSGNSIGHDIVAIIDNDPQQYYKLNAFFNPETTSEGSKGIVKFQLSNLTEGNHTLMLRVWDIYNNSSVYTFNFKVDKNSTNDIVKVDCYPNPAHERVTFRLLFNQPEDGSQFGAEIYNMQGTKIESLVSASIGSDFDRFIQWNLKSANNQKVAPGIYFYRIWVLRGNQKLMGKVQKLIVK